MGFLSQFSTYFSEQEKQTELYNMWAAIGVNMEKAIIEEQNRIDAEMTDINNFTEDTLRSWLGFFLQKIPYRTTATCQVSTTLAGEYKQTTIPKYSQLMNLDGYVYTILEEIILTSTDTRTVTAVQGKRIVENGIYSNLIKIQATNPDLTYLTLKINGVKIPEVSYQTSYDQLSYVGAWKPENEPGKDFGGTPYLNNGNAVKGQFYTVIADGQTKFEKSGVPVEFRMGDIVVYDGLTWGPISKTNNLRPIQFTNSYAIPQNGFFAYYYGGYLYVKVFSGTEVENPEGQSFELTYISSDGVQGETEANSLSYVSTFEDSDETTVELEVRNTKSTVAVNKPTVGKLGLYLKQRLYGSINVSSVPEYTAWFKSQPEVGDCLVLSDYERYKRSGVFENTGIVSVYVTDNNGNELPEEAKISVMDRLEQYKDIAVVQINSFATVKHHIEVQYSTVNSVDPFEQFIKATVAQSYDLSYLQSTNGSLFDDLDIASLVKSIQSNETYQSTGLIVKGYHYKEVEVLDPTSFDIESYEGELPGTGWYDLIFYEHVDNNYVEIKQAHFVEDAEANGICFIYDSDNLSSRIGSHLGTAVTLDLSAKQYKCDKVAIKCYWGMKNEGILTIGTENGLRKLQSVNVKRLG